MAYSILVALLVVSCVTAYPGPWQQRQRPGRRPQFSGGPQTGDRPRFGMDEEEFMPGSNGGGRPRPRPGQRPGGNGGYFPRPEGPGGNGDFFPRPEGPGSDGGFFPESEGPDMAGMGRPGPRPEGPRGNGGFFPEGPDMPDWGVDEPWFPDMTDGGEGCDENEGDGGWSNGDGGDEEPTGFPDRGDKRDPWSQGEWGPGARRPRRNRGPNRRNPGGRRPGGAGGRFPPFGGRPMPPSEEPTREFTPIVKLDNVTLPNVTEMHLKEGENIFLLPMGRPRGPPRRRPEGRPEGPQEGPQEMNFYGYGGPQPYIKLILNPQSTTQRISFEYGITQLLPSFG
ncbi:S-antigen protein-like isoform X2 [Engraulis encrasicolus]|uniref:S-antigen protein-like isoform X2 n=1 Tax=Engraulis encrasicolus TaxID=184585 RepID=UPI002FCEC8EA